MAAEPNIDRIGRSGVIAVLVIERVEDAVPVGQALLDGGVDVMELTLRTPAAMEALRAIRAQLPGMLAGAGTVLNAAQVEEVLAAGGAFAVAPGTNPRVIRAAQSCGLPFYPGVATPSDLEMALQLGCRVVKFFPAEPTGGVAYLRSMAAPYDHLNIRYIPLGGIHRDHLAAYIAEHRVLAVGGSWLAPRDLIRGGQWQTIRRNAEQARHTIEQCRDHLDR